MKKKERNTDYLPKISRRKVLKGMGVALTLPWLESLAWAQGEPGVDAPPRRYCAMMFANGVKEEYWWAKGKGKNMELSYILEPLAPHREDILVLDGLHVFDKTSGVHWPYFTNFYSGGVVNKNTVPNVAVSADQVMARTIGKQTAVPSTNFGIEPTRAGLRLGLPDIVWGTFSWRDKNTPVPAEIYPRQAFDRLFDVSGLIQKKSVLDAVLEQSKDLQRDLGAQDKAKLEEYMQSIREVEERIERAAKDERQGSWRPSLEKPDVDRPESTIPKETHEHMRLMLDIMVLGLQTDKTRIATFLFNRDSSNMKFDFLEGVEARPMHGGISHHNNDPAVVEMYKRVNQYHVEHLAYVLDKMKNIDEGGTSLLDNTMLLFGTTMIEGNRHDAQRVPLVLCGKGGGSIKTGRVVNYTKLEDQRVCNLHLAMMQRMGVDAEQFGNSNYALPNLS
ncbi:MAG: DUF1552 domain-containing protein [bacterium]